MRSYSRFIQVMVAGVASIAAFSASARQIPAAEEYLKTLREQGPATLLNLHPEKRNADGSVVPRNKERVSDEAVQKRTFVDEKDTRRQKHCMMVKLPDGGKQRICLRDVLPGRAPSEDNDEAVNLVDSLQYTSLGQMENNGLLEATLSDHKKPWSDDYWGIYAGILAHRYADGHSRSTDWQTNYSHFLNRQPGTILYSGSDVEVDGLSPGEKFDAVMGDESFSLTNAMWEEGRRFAASGPVETWMGICHGWSPAALMMERPIRSQEVQTPSGRTITFHPSDIRALGSLLWANAPYDSRFVGGRCNNKDPQTDGNGRILDQACFDNNPKTWHLSIVNQLDGGRGRSFVMDATYDYEVWNQPVLGYRYSYFNPATQHTVDNIRDAQVELTSFTNDPFTGHRRMRQSGATHVVGIAMEVEYVVEVQPDQHASPYGDGAHRVTYLYDLEIAAPDGDVDRGAIVGGEWYSNKHPDFLWTPEANFMLMTAADAGLRMEDWSGRGPLPQVWRDLAPTVAGAMQPLGVFVNRMFKLAAH